MSACRAFLAIIAAAGVAACGLKGPLELPERSGNIVIRGPGEAPATEAPKDTTPGAATPATPSTPATRPAPTDERLPPPPLPDGNPGSARGD